MRSPFGSILKQTLIRRKLTQRQFAAQVDVTQGFVAQVIAGLSRLPPDRVEPWADALQLRGKERRRFVILGHLTQVPIDVQKEVAGLLDQP